MMTTTQPYRDIANQNASIIRALSSITSQQAETIAQAVQTGTAWDMQVADDYDGYLSILVEPTIQGNDQKAFFIAGTAQRLELFEAHEDNLIALASFSDADCLSAQLVALIGQQ